MGHRCSAVARFAGGINSKAVALLRWYPANLTTSFNGGNSPNGLAFDGANIRVTYSNLNVNTVTKVRASDGANLGTFNAGNFPSNLVYDGANIWVTNYIPGTVTKLRASDGAKLGTFSAGGDGIAFDGANIWVTSEPDNTVTKLRAVDGANLGTRLLQSR
jgi:hypothetical protein